jgi:hypothetical protein
MIRLFTLRSDPRIVPVLCETRAVKAAGLDSFPTKLLTRVCIADYRFQNWGLIVLYTANAALHAMNGVQLGTKQIVVRLHEPKQLRQEKLAQRYGHNGHPRSASGATSPTISEAGDYNTWSPRARSATLGSPHGAGSSKPSYDRTERSRRGSGSYYNVSPRRNGLRRSS